MRLFHLRAAPALLTLPDKTEINQTHKILTKENFTLMVKQFKTLNVAQGGYEAPRCKVYSLTVESVMNPASVTPDSANSGYDNDNDLGDLS